MDILFLLLGIALGAAAMFFIMKARTDNVELQLKFFRDNITSTTEKILKQRTEQLHDENSRQMEALFSPLRDNIRKMEISMNDNRTAHDNNTGKLEKAMQMMMQQAQSIGDKADQLSTALQHKNKVMGNWGELILTNILESQGFTNGKEFDAQLAMRDEDGNVIYNEETGSKMIPDVVLHLPDNRDLIIDAKMSLTAFVEYQNATSDVERESAALRHIESVRAHVKELSAKNYSHYVRKPRVSCDFVIMFLPHEGAMQLLMEKEPELWNRAFTKHNVYIISGQYLMAAVHMINIAWQQVQQDKNTQEIMKNARILVERTELFYTRFLALGKKMEDVRKAYDDLDTTVRSGNKSIAASGRAFARLGVPTKGILPEEEEEEED
ncbi:MAG: DNA recombination protein RmuC [Bacteroidaceae bacterium]|nr:DNA recombination protein RmuC [Bacteroidaceae bacterium]